MRKCPVCGLWLPAGHVHSQAECDEHIREGRAIERRDRAWQRKYAPRDEQIRMWETTHAESGGN